MGFLSDVVGSIGDFVSDPIGTTGKALDNTWYGLGDLGDYIGAQTHSLYTNLDDIGKTELKQMGANFLAPIQFGQNVLEDPLDPQSYTKAAGDWYSDTKRYGEDQYGTGGYGKALANVLTSGNPFSGAGNTATQAYVAANGGTYDSGNTGGAQNLASLWNMGNKIYDGVTAPSGAPVEGANVSDNSYGVPAGEPSNNFTYQEMGVDGSPVNVHPDLYGMGTTAGQYLNSPLGQVGRAVAGALNPTLGAVLNAGAGASAGDAGAVARSLGGWYVNNKAEQQQKKYQDQIQQQLGFLNSLYTPNSAYAQQLRKQLAARDAAAGRASQYGERETQLMAELAGRQAGLAPATSMLTNGAMQASMAAQNAARSRQLGTLLSMFQSPGKTTNAAGQTVNQQAPIMQGWDDFKSLLGG